MRVLWQFSSNTNIHPQIWIGKVDITVSVIYISAVGAEGFSCVAQNSSDSELEKIFPSLGLLQ